MPWFYKYRTPTGPLRGPYGVLSLLQIVFLIIELS